MKKKLTLGFLVTVGALVAIFFGVTQKAYPVATVNDAFVSARSFQIAATATRHYYEYLNKVSGEATSTMPELFESYMRQIALHALIEDRLVTAQLQALFEVEPLNAAITDRVNQALASSSQVTEEAVSELFGITLSEFKEVVLAPRARVELLQAEFLKTGTDFNMWLQEELMSARVSISVNDLTWGAGQVELTGEQSYTAKVKEIFEQVASTTSQLVASSTVSSSSSE